MNLVGLTERIAFVRTLGIDPRLQPESLRNLRAKATQR
ncbi:hypothetical protein ACVIVC_000001, partial [Sinorhizobium meliloti]